MGCIPSRGTSQSPQRGVERLKLANGYMKAEDVGNNFSKTVAGDGDRKVDGGNVLERVLGKKIDAEELVDGWPKWLVDNVPKDALAGFDPKSADSYDKLAKVGKGTYSNVYKGQDKSTGKIVALKKVRFDTSEPASVKFMAREIIILKKLDHPNIIKLEGIATSRMQYSLYLVFDFMPSDLTKLISRPDKLTEPQVKSYMQQLLAGLNHCHKRGILHRDIKGSNLLIDENGVLKIADFGLANFYKNKPKHPLTSRVVTLWYRAPELLLGSTDYGIGIELWSVGCLLAEMFVGRPIMPGSNEIEQLHKIFKLCGSPTEDYWKTVRPPATFRPAKQYKTNFKETFPYMPDSALALLAKLLTLDPASRGTVASALESEFFTTSPLPCDLSGLPAIKMEEQKPAVTMDQKRMLGMKQESQKMQGSHRRKVSITELIGNALFAKQEIEAASNKFLSQDSGTNPGTRSSSSKPNTGQEIPPGSPTPAFRCQQNRCAKTEAHPNALKNIRNYPLLLASLTLQESNNSGIYQRSVSNIDFRNLNPEKISKMSSLEDN